MNIVPMKIIHPVVKFTDEEKPYVVKYLQKQVDNLDEQYKETYQKEVDEFERGHSECRLHPDGISGVEQITYDEKGCIFYPLHRHYSGGRVWSLNEIKRFIDTHSEA